MSETYSERMAPQRGKIRRLNTEALATGLDHLQKQHDLALTRIAVLEREHALLQTQMRNLKTQLASIMSGVGVGPTAS